MGPEIGICYRCRRPLREADFRRGLAIQVGSLLSCDACAEPLLARLTPEQRRAIFRKLEGDPPPDDGVTVEDLSAQARTPPRTPSVRAHARPPSARPPTVSGLAGPPTRKQGVPPVVWIAGAGTVLVVLFFALAGGSGRQASAPPPGDARQPAAPTRPEPEVFRPSDDARQREALQAEIAALEKDVRSLSEAQAYRKAMDALAAARPRHGDLGWTQAVDRLTREVRDASGGAFIRLRSKLQEALDLGDADRVQALQRDVEAWGLAEYIDDVKRQVGDIASRLKSGLACWLRLDETDGTTAADASGNGRAGRLRGSPTWQPSGGRIGGALAFDGVDDQVEIAPRPVQDDFTLAFWMRTRQRFGGHRWFEGAGLVDAENPGEGGDFGTALTGDRVAFGTGGPGDPTIHSRTPVNDGAWHHVAAVRTRLGAMSLFIDGALEASGASSAGSLSRTRRIVLGSIQTDNNYFCGSLDDVRIYSRALSATEVRALVEEAGAAPPPPPALPGAEDPAPAPPVLDPVGWWALDESAGTTASDASGRGHAGRLSGSPAWEPGGGRIGGALRLGVTDDVRVSRHPDLEPAAVTVAAWIFPAEAPMKWSNVVRKTWRNNSGPSAASFALQLNPNGKDATRAAFVTGHASRSDILESPPGLVVPGRWILLAGVYDPAGPAPQKRFYVNGAPVANRKMKDPLVYDPTPTGDLYFGQNGKGDSGERYDGRIDDVRIYNRALTAEEIAALARH